MESRRQRVQDIQPRVHRGTTFAFLRAATNVVLRDLNTTFVVRSMSLGAPVIYTDLIDYDEIAHHAGPERIESLRALTGVDRVIASLERAAEHAPRAYRFVLLSDHGQSQGATFAAALRAVARGAHPGAHGWPTRTWSRPPDARRCTALSTRCSRSSPCDRASPAGPPMPPCGAVRWTAPWSSAPRTHAPRWPSVPTSSSAPAATWPTSTSRSRASACAPTRWRSTIRACWPAWPGTRASASSWSAALRRPWCSAPGACTTSLTTASRAWTRWRLFGPRAADHLRRLDGFDNVGDLLINSVYDPTLQEVAAFEELVGSHGGMGGPQNRPFLLHPAELALDGELLVGAPAVHQQLQHWARQLDVTAPIAHADTQLAAPSEAKGLRWVTAWLVGVGSFELILAAAILLAALGGAQEAADIPLGVAPLLVPLVLGGIGLVAVLAGIGIWRRQRWAWMATLVIGALNVLQVLLGLAREGISGIVAFGAVPAVASLVLFWYLTRPHVAAAFGRKRRGRARPG